MDLIPKFFIYDRTAALNDGDDPITAILYPRLDARCECDSALSETTCRAATYSQRAEADITKLSNILGSLILVVNKLQGEIGCSLPQSVHFLDGEVSLLHIDKYTLALRSSHSGPQDNPQATLQLIYVTFVAFYGGFQTIGQHTTKDLKNENADRSASSHWCRILHLAFRDTKSRCLSSLAQRFNSDVFYVLTSRLAILLESMCASQAVLGAVSLYQNDVIFSYNLLPTSIQALRLVIQSNAQDFGHSIHFDGNDVKVYKCYIKDSLILINHDDIKADPNDASCYAIIHLKGELSLTLIVRSTTDSGAEIFTRWRRLCTRIRDELLQLYMQVQNLSSDLQTPDNVAQKSLSIDSLRLKWSHQLSTLAVTQQSKAIYDSPSAKKLASPSVLHQREETFRDLTTEISGVYDQIASVSAIQLTHADGYSVESYRTEADISYTGSISA